MKLNFTYTDELYHFGVKGMKWGVRKQRAGKSGLYGGLIGKGLISNIERRRRMKLETVRKQKAKDERHRLYIDKFKELANNDEYDKLEKDSLSKSQAMHDYEDKVFKSVNGDPAKYNAVIKNDRQYKQLFNDWADADASFYEYQRELAKQTEQYVNSEIEHRYGYSKKDLE